MTDIKEIKRLIEETEIEFKEYTNLCNKGSFFGIVYNRTHKWSKWDKWG